MINQIINQPNEEGYDAEEGVVYDDGREQFDYEDFEARR